mgnify:CR=1 FL=1
MTIRNNFTTNENGADIELAIACDTDIAAMEFQENFEEIAMHGRGGPCDTPVLFFTDNQQMVSDTLYNVKLVPKTQDNGDNDLRQYLHDYTPIREDEIDNMTSQELHEYVLDDASTDIALPHEIEELHDILSDYGHSVDFEHDIQDYSVKGHGQGDLAYVFVDFTQWEKLTGADKETLEKNIYREFQKMLYDLPVNGHIFIDGAEFHPDELLSERYDYDKQEIINGIMQKLQDNPGLIAEEYRNYGRIEQDLQNLLPSDPDIL